MIILLLGAINMYKKFVSIIIYCTVTSCGSTFSICDNNGYDSGFTILDGDVVPSDAKMAYINVGGYHPDLGEQEYEIYHLPDGIWSDMEPTEVSVVLEDDVYWTNPIGGFSEGTWGTDDFGVRTFEVTSEVLGFEAPPVPTLTTEVSGYRLTVEIDVAEDAWWVLEVTAPKGERKVRTGRSSVRYFSWSRSESGDYCGMQVRPGSTLRARAVSVTGAMSDWSEAVAP
jgi:hypothetical protein